MLLKVSICVALYWIPCLHVHGVTANVVSQSIFEIMIWLLITQATSKQLSSQSQSSNLCTMSIQRNIVQYLSILYVPLLHYML